MFNGEKLDALSHKTRNKTRISPLTSLSYSTSYWKFQLMQKGKKKEINKQIIQEEIKQSQFMGGINVYVEKTEEVIIKKKKTVGTSMQLQQGFRI